MWRGLARKHFIAAEKARAGNAEVRQMCHGCNVVGLHVVPSVFRLIHARQHHIGALDSPVA